MLRSNYTTDSIELCMVGMRFHDINLYHNLRDSPEDYEVYVKHEPNNHEDSNAIAVYVRLKSDRGAIPARLGFVKKEHSLEFRQNFYIVAEKFYKIFKVSNFNVHYAVLHFPMDTIRDGKQPILATTVNPCSEISLSNGNIAYQTTVAPNLPTKGQEMSAQKSVVNNIMDNNEKAARSAAYLEAGRIANNQATKLFAAKAPMMVRGYVDTPVGKLMIANAASMAAQKLRANDVRLQKLTEAMMTQAWQEVYQIVDVEKMIDDMLNSATIKKAFDKLEEAAPATE